jgi:ribosome modulation factor
MHENNDPMKKQLVYAEGKLAFADGRRRSSNPYRWHNKELESIWVDGWDQAKADNVVKKNRRII